ncbi:ABC transporter ATP-binding protein [Thermospira aquatica]|uniref:ATP-binding cassette domain-containing protein n=1 Tax=Thermospira aquatica TaxID=2828656 RepID=A0AAX3BFR9_9SPIR|nr:ATP-binding cassette domain-containing protein [Thermospira aquatica]URA10899.1 ATP-binding cassette domain-containing protein [Thermospira aquatica]
MIELQNITHVFYPGTPDERIALKNLSLKVNKGDFITIIGSNGAGKTTLFNLIAGTYRPSQGRILINDIDVTNTPEYKRAKYIGRIFQNPLLGTASNMSLEDNMMICYRKGFKWPVVSLNHAMREKFRKELEKLQMGLEHRMKDNLALFSGGQRQALTLLMMVLSRPELILLDEHTAALDPKNASKILALTKEFIEEYQLTAMMITHNMTQAIEYGNRLLMMDEGEIILDISGEEKKNLTVEDLVEQFHRLRQKSYEDDRALLSEKKP